MSMPDPTERPGPLRRAARLLRSKLHTDVHAGIAALHADLAQLRAELAGQRADLTRLGERLAATEADAARAARAARLGYEQEPECRRRLQALRRDEEYELAFTETEPLVSFIVPTYDSHRTLGEVALPSILSQTYANLEVIVVGDCAPPEAAETVAAIGDPRVTYVNRTVRGPYPEDRSRRWYVIGGPPFNEGLARARGRWIAALGDDDAVRPHHTEALLAAARQHRYEHCYGRQQVNFAEGEPLTLGRFPPELGQWGLQAAIYHSGLRFFESELLDADYEEPGDWSKCRRMLRAGVRFGMVDTVVVDKHESRRRSARDWLAGEVPLAD